jgi:lipopolysaccharide transport system permease protein
VTARLFLLRTLVRRDFQGRYAGTAFGPLWSLATPLVHLALFTFVFSIVIGVRGDPRWPDVPFGLLLFAGMLPWLAINEAVTRSATAITDNAHLVRKAHFPAAALIGSIVLAALLHAAIAAGVLIVAVALWRPGALTGLPLLAIVVPLQLLLTLGLGLLAASINTFVRDAGHLVSVALGVWFYLTPIVYPPELVPAAWRGWLSINPLTPLVDLYRQAFLGGPLRWPDGLLALALLAPLIYLAGHQLFQRLTPHFADHV